MKWTRFATVMVFWDAQSVRGATTIEWSTTLIPMGDWYTIVIPNKKRRRRGLGLSLGNYQHVFR